MDSRKKAITKAVEEAKAAGQSTVTLRINHVEMLLSSNFKMRMSLKGGTNPKGK